MLFNILYPVLFSLIPIFIFYNKNIGEVRFKEIAKLIFITIFIYIVIYIIMYLIIKNIIAINTNVYSYSITSAVIFFGIILFYTPWYKIRRLKSRYAYQYIIKYILYLLITALICLSSIIQFTLTIIFMTILLLNIIYSIRYSSKNIKEESIQDMETVITGDKPNIYHIILDSYMGDKGLMLTAQFDNSNFENILKNMGFKILKNVYSNYNHTAASIPSTMNMGYTNEYLDNQEKKSELYIKEPQQYRFLRIIRSKTINILKSSGYKIIFNGSIIFNEKIQSMCSDLLDISETQNNVILHNVTIINFLKMTILGSLYMKSSSNTEHAKYIKYLFSNISKDLHVTSPYYYFSHILAPHPPFCFKKDGSINHKYADMIESPEFN